MSILHDPLYLFRALFPRLTARERFAHLALACAMLAIEERAAAAAERPTERPALPSVRLLEDRR